MTHEEYTNELLKLWSIAHVIDAMPLTEMLDVQDHAEAVGPLIDPTLYIHKGQQLSEDKSLTRAAIAFRTGVRKIGKR